MPNFKSDAGMFLKSQRKRWTAGTRRMQKQANGRKFSEMTDREIRAIGAAFMTIKEFVEKNKGHKGHDCLFTPDATKGRPARVKHGNKCIAAARYMLLLTQGTPPEEGMVARHKCGNGHLSCVNPDHLCWGTVAQNIGDMTRHRYAGENVQDRINALPD